MDKFALVYEFNKDSPLMTYKASRELEAKNYPKALELLSTAIEKYPFHPTAYFLLALALAHNNQFDKAKEMLSIGDDLLNEKNTSEFYTNAVEKIRLEKQGISVSFDDTVNDVLDEAFIEPNEFNPVEELALIDDEFEQNTTETHFQPEENSIVTETLAEIYASQSNFDEALEIYEKLKTIKPELSEKFDSRIDELQIAIENKKQKRFGN